MLSAKTVVIAQGNMVFHSSCILGQLLKLSLIYYHSFYGIVLGGVELNFRQHTYITLSIFATRGFRKSMLLQRVKIAAEIRRRCDVLKSETYEGKLRFYNLC